MHTPPGAVDAALDHGWTWGMQPASTEKRSTAPRTLRAIDPDHGERTVRVPLSRRTN
jgi:hypothetical protein